MIDRTIYTNGITADVPVPISDNATVPTEQMARLLADALQCDGKKVMEIGTGSGYQAAVLAERASEVVTIECNPVEGVAEKLPANVTCIVGDGCKHDTGEQFDGILVTCSADGVLPAWKKQLRSGGSIVVPISLVSGLCAVTVFEKRGNKLEVVDICCYAPFTSMEVR